jgi:hypothetical protein
MYVAMLIQKFSTRTRVPVDVNDVVKYLRDCKISDYIEFIGVNIDHNILRGMHYRTKKKTTPSHGMGDPVYSSDIYYANSLSRADIRLGCCKELIHLLDPQGSMTARPADVKRLVDRIVLPPDVVDPAEDGDHATTDRIALTQALAVLFPWATREQFLRPLEDKRISLERIAEIVDLPVEYVRTVMSPVWEEIHAGLLKYKWPPQHTGTDPSGYT